VATCLHPFSADLAQQKRFRRAKEHRMDRTAVLDDTRSPSLQSRLFTLGVGLGLRPALQVAHRSETVVRAARPIIDRATSCQRTAGSITLSRFRSNGLRGLWLEGPEAAESGRVILYLHGGAFVVCSPESHKGLVSGLCHHAGAAALLLRYRLAPEHPFPAAAEDALAAYQMLLSRGYDPSLITVAGDSAGGHLVGRLLADIDELRLPMPAGALLLSPFLDLTAAETRARDKERRDPFVPPNAAAWAGRLYAGELDPEDQRLDVIGRDHRRWPPVMIQIGDTECLLPDSLRLAARLEEAGVPVELQLWPGQVHVFQAFGRMVPEARDARREAGRFIREVSSGAVVARTA
jgi:acetyl esterase/lipase